MAKLLELTCVGARQQVVFLYAFLISGLTNSAILAVEFIVEEQMPLTNRHFHHTRHARASRSAPYKSAASSTTSTQSHEYDSFSLNCPHVADASNSNVRIEVTWTLNDTIWLKIEDGEKRIYNRLTTFNKRIIAGKTVLRVLLNDGRYFFDYDELTGDFAMEIRPKGNTHTLTSRSRVKVPHGHRAHNNRPLDSTRYSYDYLPPLRQQNPVDLWDAKPNKVTSFTRNDQGVVQISREDINRPKTVVFDRQAALAAQNRHAHASIDYELSMNENGEEPYYLPRSRARSTYYSAASYLSMSLMFVNLLILHMII
ncbi:unnamed protein product [Cylicocyclus nassatus]|uniref:Uncharacterized protein n=1 Tax=Cylicocyclus nassatus TaxID=53992 RepID=A0AA36GGC6_CYLNA|nr:unnamed protein product [Cylicocyclus nassatus]